MITFTVAPEARASAKPASIRKARGSSCRHRRARLHIERFDDVRALASREHELRHEWSLNGWRPLDSDGDFDEDQ